MSLETMLQSAETPGAVMIDQGWGQGRATYGGLVGALLLRAIKGALPGGSAQPLRSVTVSFVAPAAPGHSEIEATILRSGSNVTQGQAVLRQSGDVMAVALASFGRHRESAVSVTPSVPMPDLPPSETIKPIPFLEGLTPDFFRHIALRLASGNLPFSGSPTATMSGWMSLRETPATFEEEHLVALADAWPPAVIQMLTTPAPASTLTWTLEFVGELGDSTPPDTHWGYEVVTDSADDGYAHTHATLWSPNGELMAISRQTITVFG